MILSWIYGDVEFAWIWMWLAAENAVQVDKKGKDMLDICERTFNLKSDLICLLILTWWYCKLSYLLWSLVGDWMSWNYYANCNQWIFFLGGSFCCNFSFPFNHWFCVVKFDGIYVLQERSYCHDIHNMLCSHIIHCWLCEWRDVLSPWRYVSSSISQLIFLFFVFIICLWFYCGCQAKIGSSRWFSLLVCFHLCALGLGSSWTQLPFSMGL